MPFSEVDDIAKLRRENRTFRYALWELQRAGWYHGYHGWDLLEVEEEGHFLVHDGPCMSHVSLHDCHCLFVIEESNGIDKTPSSIGIIFDDEANTSESTFFLKVDHCFIILKSYLCFIFVLWNFFFIHHIASLENKP